MTKTRYAGFCIALCAGISAFQPASQADAPVPAAVTDLAWMTGTWVGQFGDRILEENWTRPDAGSIAAVVRMTGNGATSMVELLVIREENDSLALLVQHWNPGMEPLAQGLQKLVLAELSDNRARFQGAVPGSGFRTLTYSRPAPGLFRIEVELQEGEFSIDLAPRAGATP